MLRQWFNRYTMLAKTFIILVVTIMVAGGIMFVLMTNAVSTVVTKQVQEGTRNTLDVAVNQLGSLTNLSNSILISLKTDKGLEEFLQEEPSSAYANWITFNASSLRELKRFYEERWQRGEVPSDSIWTSLALDVALMDNEAVREDYYVQYIPMGTPGKETLDGVAMVLIPKLLLQPVVENCIIHGFAETMQNGIIRISTECHEDFWYIRVSNNGVVVEHEIDLRNTEVSSADRFSGIGTMNVNNRLKLYFGEGSGLRIYADEENWTVSELKIAYENQVEMEERSDESDAGG